MNLIHKIKEKNNFPLILFFVVLINYLPLFINNAFSKESKSVNVIVMMICFIIEIALLVFFYFCNRKDVSIDKKKINTLFTIVGIMTVVQIKNFLQDDFFIMDIFNIGCIFVNICLLYISVYEFEIDEEKIEKFFKGIFFVGIIATIWNVILFNQEILNNLGIIKLTSNPYKHGIKGFFANRNSLAFFLYVSIISNCFLILFENEKKRYKVSLFVLLFGAWCTYSKTGWTIAVIFLELFFILNDKYKIKEKIIICTIIGILGVLGFMNITGQISAKGASNVVISESNVKNLSGRTDIWKRGFGILNESPINYIFGIGRFNSTSNLVFKTRTFTQFHNVYLDILLTGGLVQLIYTGLIYLSVLIKVIKSGMDKNFKMTYTMMFLTYAAYIMMESCGRFSIGAVDTLCMIFFITIPIVHANSCSKIKNSEENSK